MSLSVQENTYHGSAFQGLRSPGLFAKRPIIGLMLFLFGTLLFGVVAYSLKTSEAFLHWDMGIATTLHNAEPNVPWFLMENLLFGFFLGKEIVIAIGVILAIYFVYKHFWRDVVLVLISFSGGGLIWYFLSRYFDRPRPPYQLKDVLVLSDSSFPSGLALMAVVCYGLLAYLLVPKMSSRFWKWVVAIAFTVVILFVGAYCLMFGAHYVTDVIAGYALGLAWVGLVYTLVEKLFPETIRDRAGSTKRTPSQGLRTPGWFKERPIIGVAMVLLGGLSFAALAYNLVTHGPLIQLDMSVYKVLLTEARGASPRVYEIMLFGFFVGKQLVQVIVTVLSVYFLYKRFWRELAMINISSAGGGLLWNFLINYFARPRPPEQTGLHITSIPTFPSGHATGVLICFTFLAYLLIPKMPSRFWKWTLGIVILFVILFDGFSRVFQANHYLTDVLAGYALGLAWLGLVCTVIEVLFIRRKNEKSQRV